MKLVGRELLQKFCDDNPDCRRWISAWIADVRGSKWRSPHDIKHRYASASFLATNVVIFNVRGNNYRLAVRVAYQTQIVIALWIGAHAEYNKKHF